MPHPFDRSGLASLSDLHAPEWRGLFSRLETRQALFLEKEQSFRSAAYKWPRDPLHQWSRVWEYPYVHHQLERHRSDGDALVVDVGSGVTFFPFAVAELGYRVVCTDVDPVCAGDLARASKALDSPRVSFRATDGKRLPFEDGEADVVYCISVLEHIPAWEDTLGEMARVLKPGGLLVLTVDLDMQGNSELSVEQHRRLVAAASERFAYRQPEASVHPADLLHSAAGPYPLQAPPGLGSAWFNLKQRVIKPLLGRKPVMPGGVHLAVHALTMIKKI